METGLTASDVALLNRGNDNAFGGDNAFLWIFALLLIPGLFGGGMWGNNRNSGEAVTESALCNSMNFNNLENAVGRLGDQLNSAYMGVQNGISSLGYTTLQNFGQIQRDMCTSSAAITAAVNAAAAQSAQCCCETQQALLENRYLAAQNTAETNAVTVAQTQKILDALCQNRMAEMQSQINALQLQGALCNVVRYPSAATYSAGNSIWSNSGCGCC
jgi:hypothetical protein